MRAPARAPRPGGAGPSAPAPRRGSRRPAGRRERAGSTPARCHDHDGMRRSRSGAGSTAIPFGAGPGAGSPWARASQRCSRTASWPVTRCSSTALTSASYSRPVEISRSPGLSWRDRRSCSGSSDHEAESSKALQSSSCPHHRGASSRKAAAPAPQASTTTSRRSGSRSPARENRAVTGASPTRAVIKTRSRDSARAVVWRSPRVSGPSDCARSSGPSGLQRRRRPPSARGAARASGADAAAASPVRSAGERVLDMAMIVARAADSAALGVSLLTMAAGPRRRRAPVR